MPTERFPTELLVSIGRNRAGIKNIEKIPG